MLIPKKIKTLVSFVFFVGVSRCLAQTDINEKSIRMDSASWNSMDLIVLEPFNRQFEYFLVDTLEMKGVEIVLIERRYPEENFQWMCLFDEKSRLKDVLTSGYTNSEGAFDISYKLGKNSVKIYSWNEYSTPQESVEIYKVSNDGFVLKKD